MPSDSAPARAATPHETLPHTSGEAAAGRLELTVVREAGVATTRSVTLNGDFFRIGADPQNDLVLDDPHVSRFHCDLTRHATGWCLGDTCSLNGTRLDGVRTRDADLPAGECMLALGDSAVRVRELTPIQSVSMLIRPNFGNLYGRSIAMRKLFAILESVSQSESNVLIEGESGTGKELVASEIVKRGPRSQRPFVVVDCGSIPPSLAEATLFGYARGAFTGAERDRAGAFEAAHEGTVFLDEVGELPLDLQPKLLRVLESKTVCRVGETRARRVDVRIIAATNRRLEREINLGRFRHDLYYRLAVVTVRIPPLRERREDIPLLVPALLESLNGTAQESLFTPTVLEDLSTYDWPGNVRELRNYVERAIVLRSAAPPSLAEEPSPDEPAREAPADIDRPLKAARDDVIASFEQRYIVALLDATGGNVTEAARRARVDRMTIHRMISRYGLKPARSFRT